jgi:hypothetical protein
MRQAHAAAQCGVIITLRGKAWIEHHEQDGIASGHDIPAIEQVALDSLELSTQGISKSAVHREFRPPSRHDETHAMASGSDGGLRGMIGVFGKRRVFNLAGKHSRGY